jgi:hypothetical protein
MPSGRGGAAGANVVERHARVAAEKSGGPCPNWLQVLREELGNCATEAAEEGLPTPSEVALKNAVTFLGRLESRSELAAAAYPTSDREIAVAFKNPDKQASVALLFEADGGASCFSAFADDLRRAHYNDATILPDEFVRARLRALSAS